MDMRVRELPEEHDPGNRMEAMQLAEKAERPALGVFFCEQRPTLCDEMDDIVRRAPGDSH